MNNIIIHTLNVGGTLLLSATERGTYADRTRELAEQNALKTVPYARGIWAVCTQEDLRTIHTPIIKEEQTR